LLIRPQQKKVRQHREIINNLKRGDKIITSGGIIGTVNKVLDNRELVLEIADEVEIRIAPGMVTDLYIKPQEKKDNTSSNSSSDKKGSALSSLFGSKK